VEDSSQVADYAHKFTTNIERVSHQLYFGVVITEIKVQMQPWGYHAVYTLCGIQPAHRLHSNTLHYMCSVVCYLNVRYLYQVQMQPCM